MMRVRSATSPAPGRPENEDACFTVDNLVGVLDGVTAPDGLDNGCVHTVAWYVQRLVARLLQVYTDQPGEELAKTLGRAIELVRGDHGPDCNLNHPGTHAATIALLRNRDRTLDYLVLCEATIAFDRAAGVEIVTDPRFAQAVADIRKRAFTDRPEAGTTENSELLQWVATERRKLTNRDDGYWVAAADPSAAEHAITGVALLHGPNAVQRAALLTDGTSSLVDRFGELDWPALLELADEKGPAEVIRAVRAVELNDPHGRENPRYKRHDDATIAICTFKEDRQ